MEVNWIINGTTSAPIPEYPAGNTQIFANGDYIEMETFNFPSLNSINKNIEFLVEMSPGVSKWLNGNQLWNGWTNTGVTWSYVMGGQTIIYGYRNVSGNALTVMPKLKTFNLENLDDM